MHQKSGVMQYPVLAITHRVTAYFSPCDVDVAPFGNGRVYADLRQGTGHYRELSSSFEATSRHNEPDIKITWSVYDRSTAADPPQQGKASTRKDVL